MYDLIKEQFISGRALSQGINHGAIRRELWPHFYEELFPLGLEYYHELNPYFLFNVYNGEIFKFAKVFTVRDGYLTFANFILSYFSSLPHLGVKCLLIHPDLAPLVPPSLTQYFACWKIVQRKKITIDKAKKVIIFGIATEQYIGELEDLPLKLEPLSKISPDATIDLYFPLRNLFEKEVKETLAIHHLMSAIKDVLGDRKFRILNSDHFFDLSDFKNTYVFDLADDNFIVSDRYLHYYVQSRGATVNNGALDTTPEDSIFSLDLSLHHELHVTPLPKVESCFTDLIFYRKQNPAVKDLHFDPGFQGLLRELIKKEV